MNYIQLANYSDSEAVRKWASKIIANECRLRKEKLMKEQADRDNNIQEQDRKFIEVKRSWKFDWGVFNPLRYRP